jgi:hypothetical protein
MDAAAKKNLALGILGAIVGGVAGYLVFFWAVRQGFYALILPGTLVGVGGGLLVKDRSALRGILCGVLGTGLGLFAEWRFRPFIADSGLPYFLTHLHQLQPMTLIMIIAGGAFGYWLSLGKER